MQGNVYYTEGIRNVAVVNYVNKTNKLKYDDTDWRMEIKSRFIFKFKRIVILWVWFVVVLVKYS